MMEDISMSDGAGFLRAIQKNPEDEAARLVYADWLEERGDIRGEYLRLEHQLVQTPLRLAQLQGQIDPTWLASVSRRRPLAADVFRGRWVILGGDRSGWVRLDINKHGNAWSIQTWADSDVHYEASWHEDVVRYAGDEDHLPGPFVPPPQATIYLLADTVCDTEMRYGFASWDHGFADEHLTLRHEGDVLIAESFTVFKDDSGRSNYRAQYKFRKVQEPAEPHAVR
jgi:uncharacterized protein (TIGR02996 family)